MWRSRAQERQWRQQYGPPVEPRYPLEAYYTVKPFYQKRKPFKGRASREDNEGQWYCQHCGAHHFSSARVSCRRCGKPRAMAEAQSSEAADVEAKGMPKVLSGLYKKHTVKKEGSSEGPAPEQQAAAAATTEQRAEKMRNVRKMLEELGCEDALGKLPAAEIKVKVEEEPKDVKKVLDAASRFAKNTASAQEVQERKLAKAKEVMIREEKLLEETKERAGTARAMHMEALAEYQKEYGEAPMENEEPVADGPNVQSKLKDAIMGTLQQLTTKGTKLEATPEGIEMLAQAVAESMQGHVQVVDGGRKRQRKSEDEMQD